ncbi:MAG: phosphotransferase [Deltaproteobacteria bacterium]|nr:phosphotransferase [Deltaproteobacteria bacterium]
MAPLAGGLINVTYAVARAGAPVAVVQRLHRIFAPEVNLDLEAVTAHLAARGLATPRLVRTLAGAAWVVHEGATWRALTWVDGVSHARVPSLDVAEAGGELVGKFHRAVADLRHDYAFARAGVHDTAAHLAALRAELDGAAVRELPELPELDEAGDVGRAILAAAAGLPALSQGPRRHCHGDLKLSNLMFAAPDHRAGPARGVCLVDLDTLGLGTMAFELGDAMRSWCNPRGEDVAAIAFDTAIFDAAMRGFLAVAGDLVSEAERRAIVAGLETVCVELAARFAVDAFRDSYFGWDPARFPTRRAHNLVRARGQLALGLAVREARDEALGIVLRTR